MSTLFNIDQKISTKIQLLEWKKGILHINLVDKDNTPFIWLNCLKLFFINVQFNGQEHIIITLKCPYELLVILVISDINK